MPPKRAAKAKVQRRKDAEREYEVVAATKPENEVVAAVKHAEYEVIAAVKENAKERSRVSDQSSPTSKSGWVPADTSPSTHAKPKSSLASKHASAGISTGSDTSRTRTSQVPAKKSVVTGTRPSQAVTGTQPSQAVETSVTGSDASGVRAALAEGGKRAVSGTQATKVAESSGTSSDASLTRSSRVGGRRSAVAGAQASQRAAPSAAGSDANRIRTSQVAAKKSVVTGTQPSQAVTGTQPSQAVETSVTGSDASGVLAALAEGGKKAVSGTQATKVAESSGTSSDASLTRSSRVGGRRSAVAGAQASQRAAPSAAGSDANRIRTSQVAVQKRAVAGTQASQVAGTSVPGSDASRARSPRIEGRQSAIAATQPTRVAESLVASSDASRRRSSRVEGRKSTAAATQATKVAEASVISSDASGAESSGAERRATQAATTSVTGRTATGAVVAPRAAQFARDSATGSEASSTLPARETLGRRPGTGTQGQAAAETAVTGGDNVAHRRLPRDTAAIASNQAAERAGRARQVSAVEDSVACGEYADTQGRAAMSTGASHPRSQTDLNFPRPPGENGAGNSRKAGVTLAAEARRSANQPSTSGESDEGDVSDSANGSCATQERAGSATVFTNRPLQSVADRRATPAVRAKYAESATSATKASSLPSYDSSQVESAPKGPYASTQGSSAMSTAVSNPQVQTDLNFFRPPSQSGSQDSRKASSTLAAGARRAADQPFASGESTQGDVSDSATESVVAQERVGSETVFTNRPLKSAVNRHATPGAFAKLAESATSATKSSALPSSDSSQWESAPKGQYASTQGSSAISTAISNGQVNTNANLLRAAGENVAHMLAKASATLAATTGITTESPSTTDMPVLLPRLASEHAQIRKRSGVAQPSSDRTHNTSLLEMPSLANGVSSSASISETASSIESEISIEPHPPGPFVDSYAPDLNTVFPMGMLDAKTVVPARKRKQEAQPETTREAQPETTREAQPETTREAQPEATQESQPEATQKAQPEATQEACVQSVSLDGPLALPIPTGITLPPTELTAGPSFQSGITQAPNEQERGASSPRIGQKQAVIEVGSKLVTICRTYLRKTEIIGDSEGILREVATNEGLVVEEVGIVVSGRLRVKCMLDGQVGWVSSFETGNYENKIVKVSPNAAPTIRIEALSPAIDGLYSLSRNDEFGCPIYERENVTLSLKRENGPVWSFDAETNICTIPTVTWNPTLIPTKALSLNENSIACISPFSGSNTQDRRKRDIFFVDSTFLPSNTSIGKQASSNVDYVWERLERLLPDQDIELFIHEQDGELVAHPDDVYQGALGDAWFLSGIASMSERVGLISRMFPDGEKLKGDGSCRVRLFSPLTQEFEVITIDTMIPCVRNKDGVLEPAFAKFSRALSRGDSEGRKRRACWPLLLEKAAAKYVKSYMNLTGGIVSTAYQLCGCGDSQEVWTNLGMGRCHPQTLEPHYDCFSLSPDTQQEVLRCKMIKDPKVVRIHGHEWYTPNGTTSKSQLHHAMKRMGILCASGTRSGEGILCGHAYPILQVFSVKAKKKEFIQLRRPWGSEDWTGPWNNQDPRWEMIPEMKPYLQDGTFFMTAEDFTIYFGTLFVANTPQCHALAHVTPLDKKMMGETQRKSRISCFGPRDHGDVSPRVISEMMQKMVLTFPAEK